MGFLGLQLFSSSHECSSVSEGDRKPPSCVRALFKYHFQNVEEWPCQISFPSFWCCYPNALNASNFKKENFKIL